MSASALEITARKDICFRARTFSDTTTMLGTAFFISLLSVLLRANSQRFSSVLPPSYNYTQYGDLNIALIHRVIRTAGGVSCKGEIDTIVFEMAQAVLYGIDLVERDPELLPNVTLGLIIADTCNIDGIGVMRTLELLETHNEDNGIIIGVMPGYGSASSKIYAEIIQLYQMPQASAFATSNDLSDKGRYPYFFRLIPPDLYQSNAAMDIVSHFGWTYISVLYQQDSYGLSAFKRIQILAKQRKMCIAYSQAISTGTDQENTDLVAEITRNLLDHQKARVVVSFVHSDEIIDGVLDALNVSSGRGHFVFVFSEAYDSSYSYRAMLADSFFVQIYYGTPSDLFQRRERMTADTAPGFTTEDRLLRAVVASKLGCAWASDGGDPTKGVCDQQLNKTLPFPRKFYLANYVDVVRMFAHAVHNLVLEKCPDAFQNKTVLNNCVTGKDVLDFIFKTTFRGYLDEIKVDKNGDGMGQYEILQMQLKGDSYQMYKVGVWDALFSSLNLTASPKWETSVMLDGQGVPESICSRPCRPGHFRLASDSLCCWVCRKCRSNEFVTKNGSDCDVCPPTTWPNNSTDACERIKPEIQNWADPISVLFTSLATAGFLVVLTIGIIYFVHRHDRLIKASSLSLSMVVLIGVFLSYFTVFLVLATPGDVVCGIQRQTYSWSCILIYAPLLVKSNRIYRIFSAGKHGNKRPTLIGSRAQLIFTAVIVLIQVAISAVTAIVLPPTPTVHQPVFTEKRVELTCAMPVNALVIPFSYNMFVVLVTALFGYKTRKLPENFNESKCIFLSVCSTIFIWIAFMPTYFSAVAAQHKVILLASSLVLNGSVITLCLFFTRVYAIFYMDEDELLFMTSVRARNTQVGPAAPSSQVSSIAK